MLQIKISELNEKIKIFESTNISLKNELDLLKLRLENSENNYKKRIFDLEENKKMLNEMNNNFNFYNDKSVNTQMKLINNEKEKYELLIKEVDRLKNDNKELMENNMHLKEEIKKLLESKNNGNLKINSKSFNHDEHMEILLKGYKEQMQVDIIII